MLLGATEQKNTIRSRTPHGTARSPRPARLLAPFFRLQSGNEVYGNTLGVLVDLLPFLQVTVQKNTVVSFNEVHDNNGPNTAAPADLPGVFPPGIGILLVGADTTTIRKNIVTGNQFVGVGVASLCLPLSLLGQPCDGLDIDPQPDGNRI